MSWRKGLSTSQPLSQLCSESFLHTSSPHPLSIYHPVLPLHCSSWELHQCFQEVARFFQLRELCWALHIQSVYQVSPLPPFTSAPCPHCLVGGPRACSATLGSGLRMRLAGCSKLLRILLKTVLWATACNGG
uniref:Uncharacterized protein n=1 Tax=Laticauda laticaudata TaxID=8630 RepID=A0A8C5S1K2_LATLA